jgi:pimeloyl-ACP methyl ester carboxylesterase
MEPRFVTANGLRFAYLEQGTGPLVLCAHGFPDTAHTWEHLLPELAAAGFRAVAPFMRGIHPTEIVQKDLSAVSYARDLLALIPALGAEKAVLVGHDWGAAASYAAAAMAPEHVRLLITLAIPHPRSIKPWSSAAWRLRHALFLRRDSAPEKIRAGNYAYIDELWARWSPAWKVIPPEETRHVKEAYAHPGCLEAACRYYKSISPKLAPEQRLPIKVPTITFAGEHDLVPTRAFEKARTLFEGSYEVIQVPGGHFVHREHPAEVNRELVRAVREHVR